MTLYISTVGSHPIIWCIVFPTVIFTMINEIFGFHSRGLYKSEEDTCRYAGVDQYLRAPGDDPIDNSGIWVGGKQRSSIPCHVDHHPHSSHISLTAMQSCVYLSWLTRTSVKLKHLTYHVMIFSNVSHLSGDLLLVTAILFLFLFSQYPQFYIFLSKYFRQELLPAIIFPLFVTLSTLVLSF